MNVTLRLTASALAEAIETMVGEAMLSGLGADGTSDYEIVEVTTDPNSLTDFECEVTIEIEHTQGKFVGRDEFVEVLTEHIESTDVTVGLEVA